MLAALLAWWGWALEHPPEPTPRPADAVVVLGGRGDRLPLAQSLVARGLAGTLVVSAHDQPCPTAAAARVICFDPDPASTRGEAEAIARLARGHGWTRLLVVSDHEQARRAATRVGRCYTGSLQVLPAPPLPSTWERVQRVLYEAAATLKADLWQRSC